MKREKTEPKEKGIPVWVVALLLVIIAVLGGWRIYKTTHLSYEERAFNSVVNYIDTAVISTNPQIPKYNKEYVWKTEEGTYRVEIPVEETTKYGVTNTYTYEALVVEMDGSLLVKWCQRKAEE